jgi:hypothetical protein
MVLLAWPLETLSREARRHLPLKHSSGGGHRNSAGAAKRSERLPRSQPARTGQLRRPSAARRTHFDRLRRERGQRNRVASDIKKQQMRRNRSTVQPFLDVHTAALNGTPRAGSGSAIRTFAPPIATLKPQLQHSVPRFCMLSKTRLAVNGRPPIGRLCWSSSAVRRAN